MPVGCPGRSGELRKLDDSDAGSLEELGAFGTGHEGIRPPPRGDDAPDPGIADEPGTRRGPGGSFRAWFEGAVERGVAQPSVIGSELGERGLLGVIERGRSRSLRSPPRPSSHRVLKSIRDRPPLLRAQPT
ncbi:hypothetical protein GCM10010275_63690 [Streptomyces litmocidini]|nr:hypothetical protein GCM10010275_63690 [Streptomyces litmocidini]